MRFLWQNLAAEPALQGYVHSHEDVQKIAEETIKAYLAASPRPDVAELVAELRDINRGLHYAVIDEAINALSQPQSPASGDWPEDFPHENGNYQRECIFCGAMFTGHKRRVVCKLCETDPGRCSIIERNAKAREQSISADHE